MSLVLNNRSLVNFKFSESGHKYHEHMLSIFTGYPTHTPHCIHFKNSYRGGEGVRKNAKFCLLYVKIVPTHLGSILSTVGEAFVVICIKASFGFSESFSNKQCFINTY